MEIINLPCQKWKQHLKSLNGLQANLIWRLWDQIISCNIFLLNFLLESHLVRYLKEWFRHNGVNKSTWHIVIDVFSVVKEMMPSRLELTTSRIVHVWVVKKEVIWYYFSIRVLLSIAYALADTKLFGKIFMKHNKVNLKYPETWIVPRP